MRARKIVRGLREGFTEAERYAVAYHVVSQLKERAFLGTWIEIGQVSAREIVGQPRELEMRPPWNGCCAEAPPGLVAMFQLAPMEVLSHNKKNPRACCLILRCLPDASCYASTRCCLRFGPPSFTPRALASA